MTVLFTLLAFIIYIVVLVVIFGLLAFAVDLYYKFKTKQFKKKYPLFWNLQEERDAAYIELSDKGWEIEDIKNKINELFKDRVYLLSEDRKEHFERIKKYREELKIKKKEYVQLEEIKNQKQEEFNKYIAENKITKIY